MDGLTDGRMDGFTVLRPVQDYSTYMETSPLPMDGWMDAGVVE
jgi:hypothetical protein